MKRLTVVSLFTALLALSLAGCNDSLGGGGSTQYPVITKITEGNIVMEYEYDDQGLTVGESRSEGSRKIYDQDDYEYENNYNSLTAVRTMYNYPEAGTTTELKVEIDYVPYTLLEKEYQVFDGNTLVERRVTRYNDNYYVIEFTHLKDGVKLVERTDYDYTPMGVASSPYFKYKESLNGGEVVQMAQYCTRIDNNQSGGRTVREWEIYSGWESDSAKGTLIEKVTDYEESGMTASYKITPYDADGTNPVETEVEREYEMITVTY